MQPSQAFQLGRHTHHTTRSSRDRNPRGQGIEPASLNLRLGQRRRVLELLLPHRPIRERHHRHPLEPGTRRPRKQTRRTKQRRSKRRIRNPRIPAPPMTALTPRDIRTSTRQRAQQFQPVHPKRPLARRMRIRLPAAVIQPKAVHIPLIHRHAQSRQPHRSRLPNLPGHPLLPERRRALLPVPLPLALSSPVPPAAVHAPADVAPAPQGLSSSTRPRSLHYRRAGNILRPSVMLLRSAWAVKEIVRVAYSRVHWLVILSRRRERGPVDRLGVNEWQGGRCWPLAQVVRLRWSY